jgi:3-oxoadipate enol-lactonase
MRSPFSGWRFIRDENIMKTPITYRCFAMRTLACVVSIIGLVARSPARTAEPKISDTVARSGAATPQPPQSGFVTIRNGQLYYELAGSGHALVLIHGNAGDRRHWDMQFAGFARHFRVIRYDVRGFGKSSLPVVGAPYSDYEDLSVLFDHLGLDVAHVAGWSMGSGIAVDFALAHPGRTGSLVLVGPWVNGYSSPTAEAIGSGFALVREALARGGRTAAVDAWMQAPFFRDTICDRAAGDRFSEIARDHTFWAFSDMKSSRAVLEPAAIGRIAEIRAPMLLVAGDQEVPACMEIADLLAGSQPHAQKVVMTGTGHLMHMEKPAEFNRIVLNFLRRQSAPPSSRSND